VRPGTAAARRVDDVPRDEKRARLNHLLALQREVAAERNAAYVGEEVELLVEGIAADGRPYGRTRENKVAWLPIGAARVGELQAARVAESSAWQLQVEPVGTAA
jgi:tRNA-2-methylthio-N6-dimethylallyladenosine synthase